MAFLIRDFPLNLVSGSFELGPVVVPNNLHKLTLRIKRQTALTPLFWTDPATKLKAELLVSFDAGVSFQPACGLTSAGGSHIRLNGTESPETALMFELAKQPGRRLKALISVENGPLVSELTVEVN